MIELPAGSVLRVVVYSTEPQLLRPLIAANPQVDAVFESPDKYDPAGEGRRGGAGPLRAAVAPARRFHLDSSRPRRLAGSGAGDARPA